ncbi:hypothetical protein Syun_019450 [Stephania yunnanensis]|uniref:Uncharacterized protein n=1 Tax=Stephania yunnanensis TaxID=152371 RepID=A0AAP0IVU8_9MAGN
MTKAPCVLAEVRSSSPSRDMVLTWWCHLVHNALTTWFHTMPGFWDVPRYCFASAKARRCSCQGTCQGATVLSAKERAKLVLRSVPMRHCSPAKEYARARAKVRATVRAKVTLCSCQGTHQGTIVLAAKERAKECIDAPLCSRQGTRQGATVIVPRPVRRHHYAPCLGAMPKRVPRLDLVRTSIRRLVRAAYNLPIRMREPPCAICEPFVSATSKI